MTEQKKLPPGRMMRFGDVEEGMHVMSPDGPVPVSKAHEIHVPETMYEIMTDSSDVPLKASGNHLWYIETRNDQTMHSMRLKFAKNALSGLSDEAYATLEDIAYSTPTETEEVSLADMLTYVDGLENTDKKAVLSRIAKSIGHVAENTTVINDIGSVERHRGILIRMYDAVVFSQQVLALTGERKYRKQWSVKVGQVVTTEDLVHVYHDAELPVMDML